jgi:hypothetical protein
LRSHWRRDKKNTRNKIEKGTIETETAIATAAKIAPIAITVPATTGGIPLDRGSATMTVAVNLDTAMMMGTDTSAPAVRTTKETSMVINDVTAIPKTSHLPQGARKCPVI